MADSAFANTLHTTPNILRSTGPVNGSAVLRCAPALQVTLVVRYGSERSIYGRQISCRPLRPPSTPLQGRPGGHFPGYPRPPWEAHGIDGRPESVTRTWSRLRSRTAVMVAVQRCPFFACTVMVVPTSSAGSVAVLP